MYSVKCNCLQHSCNCVLWNGLKMIESWSKHVAIQFDVLVIPINVHGRAVLLYNTASVQQDVEVKIWRPLIWEKVYFVYLGFFPRTTKKIGENSKWRNLKSGLQSIWGKKSEAQFRLTATSLSCHPICLQGGQVYWDRTTPPCGQGGTTAGNERIRNCGIFGHRGSFW
jgi:hypothetical protein